MNHTLRSFRLASVLRSLPLLAALISLALAPAAFAQESGLAGTFTLAVIRTAEDPEKTHESKSWDAHVAAIAADQNSTQIVTWGMKSERIGNRQILELALGTNDVRGWSLRYVESASYTGFVAYKKDTAPVKVSQAHLRLEMAPWGPSRGKTTNRYTASNDTESMRLTEFFQRPTGGLFLLDTRLDGPRQTTRTEIGVSSPGGGTITRSFVDRFNLSGGAMVVYAGTARRSTKTVPDLTPFLPPSI
jgi:hypothetical protein